MTWPDFAAIVTAGTTLLGALWVVCKPLGRRMRWAMTRIRNERLLASRPWVTLPENVLYVPAMAPTSDPLVREFMLLDPHKRYRGLFRPIPDDARGLYQSAADRHFSRLAAEYDHPERGGCRPPP